MVLLHFLLFCLSLATYACCQITAAPSCPILADPWHSKAGLLVQKREAVTYCDVNSKFYCFLPAVCVFGQDRYIGCCTAIGKTCAPRTRCIDYTSGLSAPCDYVSGGCAYCSDSDLPFCTKQYRDDKYVLGCGTERLTTTYTDTDTEVPIPGLSTSMLSPASRPSTPSAAPTSASQPAETGSVDDPKVPSSSSGDSSASSSLPPSLMSTAVSPSTAMNSSAPAESVQSNSIASSRGLIIGVVIGAAAGSVLLLALCFILWKCWKRRGLGGGMISQEKPNKAGYSIGSGEDCIAERSNSQHDVASGQLNSHGLAELEEQSRRSTEDKRGFEQANNSADGPGSSIHQQSGHPYSPEDIRGPAEAPANAPSWPSPNTTTMTSPTPSNSSLWMVSPNLGTPRVPSQYTTYIPYTPSSAYSNSGQPPSSLLQSRYGGRDVAQESPLAELEAHEVGRAQ